jgi:hypothetical protein
MNQFEHDYYARTDSYFLILYSTQNIERSVVSKFRLPLAIFNFQLLIMPMLKNVRYSKVITDCSFPKKLHQKHDLPTEFR